MIVLVDGSNTVLRLSSAAKRSGEAGDFIRMLLEFVYWNGLDAEQMVFFWEGQNSTLNKKKIYPEYKEGRVRTQEDAKYIKTCYELAKYVLDGLNICNIQIENCEADDLIAHLALNSGENIRIISEDKDYIQLLEKDNISIKMPIKRLILKKNDVLEREGIIAENFALAKAVCGDKSDNIKGLTSIEISRLAYYFPELCLKRYSPKEFLDEISKLEYINENKFKDKRDYTFRCSLITKILNENEKLDINMQLVKMYSLSELEKNKLNYLINDYNNKEKKLDKKSLMELLLINKVGFKISLFQNLLSVLYKFSKNKLEF